VSGPAGREAREPAAYPGLLAALMAAVRPGFRSEVLGFDPRDPVFGGPPCLVDGCERPGRNRGVCRWHYQQWLVRKPDFAEFVATAGPEWHPRSVPAACQVPGCEYASRMLGFCPGHYGRYRRAGRPDPGAWIAAGQPVTPPEPLVTCLVPACGLWIWPGVVFCHAHASAWKLHGRPDPAGFAAGYGDEARLGRDRISLRALPAQLRLEWQYAFQARSDAGRQKVDTGEAQRAVSFTAGAGVTSLLDWDEDRWRQHKPPPGQPGVSATTPRSLIIYARRQVEELAFGRGWDVEYPRDTWRLRSLGISDPIANVRFGGIPQPWLKDLAKRWCRWRLATGLSPGSPARGARVLSHFGTWLAGQDENTADIGAITRPLLERYLAALRAEFGGRKLRKEHIENLNGLLTAVRQHEWDPGLPAGAMIFPEDYPKRGERLPRALAEHVMAQIEDPASLDRWNDPGRRLITLILIRCGLRIGDACKLPSDCIVADGDGQPYLRYYNHKMKREALVPVDDEIVDGIGRQRQRNTDRWPGGTPVLFPRPTKNIDGTVPANGDAYRGGLRRWLARCDIRSPVCVHGRLRPGHGVQLHRLADDVLAQHRAHRGLAVSAPGERGAPGPLEMKVAAAPLYIGHLAEQQRAAVPEAGRVNAELVAGVGLGDRRDPLRGLPGQQRDARRLPQLRRIDAQLDRQLFVEHQQLGIGRRGRRPRHAEARHLAGVGILEPEQGRRNGHASETTGQPPSGNSLPALCRASDPPASVHAVSIPADHGQGGTRLRGRPRRRPVDYRDPGPQAGRRRPPARRDRHPPRAGIDDQRTDSHHRDRHQRPHAGTSLRDYGRQGRDLPGP
jgi:integrase